MNTDTQFYVELKQKLAHTNFFKPTPWRYALTIGGVAGLFLSSYIGLYFVDGLARLPLCVFAAFMSVMWAYLSHDAGHYEVSRKKWVNDVVGQIGMSLVCGFSFTYWRQHHNRHHKYSQQEGKDPDLESSAVGLYEASARSHRGVWGFTTRHQAYLLWLLYSFHIWQFRSDGIQYISTHRTPRTFVDWLMLAGHICLWLVLPAYYLGIGMAIVNYLIVSHCCGFFYGPVFITNHAGTRIIRPDEKIPYWERQVITARNVRNHRIFDFYFAGLNFQIEHHLFPGISRYRYRPAAPMVREMCRARGIQYHETTWPRGLYEVYLHLANMARYQGDREIVQQSPSTP